PPEPMAIRPSSGSSTSPLPVMISEASLLATASSASRRRRVRSVRHSLAISTAARTRCPWCFSSWASKCSNRVKASAVPPANPAITWSWYRRRTLRALPFMTVLPSETWPSPPITTLPWRRTETIVVTRSSCWLFKIGAARCARCLCHYLGAGPGEFKTWIGPGWPGGTGSGAAGMGSAGDGALLAQQIAEAVAAQGLLGLGQSALIGKGTNLYTMPGFAVGQLGIFQAHIQPHQNDLRAHAVRFAALAEGARP